MRKEANKLLRKVLRSSHIDSLVPHIAVHQPRRLIGEMHPLPTPTLKNFDPNVSREEFMKTYESLYGGFTKKPSVTMQAYRQILIGERGLPKNPDRPKKSIADDYFKTENGQRLRRRLDRSFYVNLIKSTNHINIGSTRDASFPGPNIIEAFTNRHAGKIIKWLAKYLDVDAIRILNRKFRFAPDSDFDSAMAEIGRDRYDTSIRRANTLIPRINLNLFKGHGDMLRQWTETNPTSSRPSDMLLRATSPDYFDRPQWEAQVLGALVLLEAKMFVESRNHDINDNLARVSNFLSARLFEGKRGEAHPLITYVLYSNETNEAVGIDGKLIPGVVYSPDKYHWKKHVQEVRMLKGTDILDMWDDDIKEEASALEKALYRAVEEYREKGTVAIDIDKVTDMQRMQHVIAGATSIDDQQFIEAESQIIETLKQDPLYENIDKRVTPLTNGDSQDDLIKYSRYYVKYKGIDKRIEVIIFPQLVYFNSQYHVGKEKMNKENMNKQHGRAHVLFKLFRELQLIPLLMPKTVSGYNHDDIDTLQIAIDAYNSQCEVLFKEARVDKETSKMLSERNFALQAV